MVRRFADSGAAVVARRAGSGDTAMVEPRPGKARGRVAISAGIGAGHMIGRLPGCGATVVATCAGPGRGSVIEPHGCEPGCAMATLAFVG